MITYKIHLIRHGMTQGNLEGRYVGITDSPLCKQGRESLGHLSQEYEYPYTEQIFVSPLLRCIQTAHILYPGQQYDIVENLSECNFGVFENKHYEELKNREDFQQWVQGGMKNAPPNGESGIDFTNRCYAGFAQIVEYMMKTKTTSSAIITHGGVIMSILSSLAYPKRNFFDWMVSNGLGYTVSVTPQLWMSGSIIEVTDTIPAGYAVPVQPQEYAFFDKVEAPDQDEYDDAEG